MHLALRYRHQQKEVATVRTIDEDMSVAIGACGVAEECPILDYQSLPFHEIA